MKATLAIACLAAWLATPGSAPDAQPFGVGVDTRVGSTSLAAPDLAPPGMHTVRNALVLDWPASLGATRFVVAPAQSPTRRHEVVRGEAFPVPRGPFARARLYAVPADAGELPQDSEGWRACNWPSAPLPAKLVHSVADASPVHSVRTQAVIEGIDGATVRCRVVAVDKLDRNGAPVDDRWIALPILAAATGLALLVGIARRRKAAPAP
jgi:hypothetical protein